MSMHHCFHLIGAKRCCFFNAKNYYFIINMYKIDVKLIRMRAENKSFTIINVKNKIYSKHLFTYNYNER